MSKTTDYTTPGEITHNNLDEDIADIDSNPYEVFQSNIMNIIMIGDSRAGKSTFIQYINNINHSVSSGLYRGTVDPESQILTIKFMNKLLTVNFIDTPGLNEVSATGSRANDHIVDLISSFVRKDITKVHLILLTVNAASGINSNQLKTIMDIATSLGREFIPNICLLISNYEHYGRSQERELKVSISNDQSLKPLKIACGAGILFTGALTNEEFKDIKVRDKFIPRQKRRVTDFLNKLTKVKPANLQTEVIERANSSLKSMESIVRDYTTAARLGPEIVSMSSEIINMRVKLSKSLDQMNDDLKTRSNEMIERATSIGDPTDFKDNISSEAVNQLHRHVEEAQRVSQQVRSLKDKNNELIEIYNTMKGLLFEYDMQNTSETNNEWSEYETH
jgi:GTP-binding protein EngB required for normal cell division